MIDKWTKARYKKENLVMSILNIDYNDVVKMSDSELDGIIKKHGYPEIKPESDSEEPKTILFFAGWILGVILLGIIGVIIDIFLTT